MQSMGSVRSDDRLVLLTGIGLVVLLPVLLVILDGRAPTGPASAAVVGVLLFAASLPLLALVARRDGDSTLLTFLMVALAAKLAGGFARYYLISAAYGGLADSALYDTAGREWVAALHDGRATWVADTVSNFSAGTQALGTITGVVYALFGRNLLTGFVVFSWLGFWGLLMAYRAFRTGLPDGDHRRYRILLFFLPSLVFWPSSIGKDAWMQLCLGAIFLGVAAVTASAPRWSGAIWLVLGLLGAALLRPHIALAALAPLAVALAWRQRGSDAPAKRGGAARVVGLAVLGIGSVLLLNRLGAFFGGTEQGVAGSVTGVLDTASDITAQGGSEFDANEVSSLTDLPMATVSVLFRPFIWEANSPVRAIAGLETALLFALTLASWSRLRTLPGQLRRNRYLVYVTVFAVVSVVGFSHVGNEGILARQRTQFLPAVLVLLCLPTARRDEEGAQEASAPPGSARRLDTVPGRGRRMTRPPADHHPTPPPRAGATSTTTGASR